MNALICGMPTLTVNLATIRFPYFVQRHGISIREAMTMVCATSGTSSIVAIAPGEIPPDLSQATWMGQVTPGP
ncbi:MAG TPA: hypothetical protein VNM22_02630 [Candidatus Limnocylindrales bacterium]|nr:hypothetical protein [Candidatus Limnocylindrales bacterium]